MVSGDGHGGKRLPTQAALICAGRRMVHLHRLAPQPPLKRLAELADVVRHARQTPLLRRVKRGRKRRRAFSRTLQVVPHGLLSQ